MQKDEEASDGPGGRPGQGWGNVPGDEKLGSTWRTQLGTQGSEGSEAGTQTERDKLTMKGEMKGEDYSPADLVP